MDSTWGSVVQRAQLESDWQGSLGWNVSYKAKTFALHTAKLLWTFGCWWSGPCSGPLLDLTVWFWLNPLSAVIRQTAVIFLHLFCLFGTNKKVNYAQGCAKRLEETHKILGFWLRPGSFAAYCRRHQHQQHWRIDINAPQHTKCQKAEHLKFFGGNMVWSWTEFVCSRTQKHCQLVQDCLERRSVWRAKVHQVKLHCGTWLSLTTLGCRCARTRFLHRYKWTSETVCEKSSSVGVKAPTFWVPHFFFSGHNSHEPPEQ